MWRVTQDVVEIRGWVQGRGGWPCRLLDGRIALNFPGERCRGLEIGWDEFGPNFCFGRCVFVYDDAAGAGGWFLGSAQEAHHFVSEARVPRQVQAAAR
jgi:hypothetical protein